MINDFKAALARVQDDYDFYLSCRTNPQVALADYDLTAEERAALTDPDQLADVLRKTLMPRNRPSITIKISGTHDWVNRTRKPKPKPPTTQSDEIQREVSVIRGAGSSQERTDAAVRLMELLE
jgi:hypothetical protein